MCDNVPTILYFYPEHSHSFAFRASISECGSHIFVMSSFLFFNFLSDWDVIANIVYCTSIIHILREKIEFLLNKQTNVEGIITLTNSKMDCKSQICLHLQFQQVVYFFCSLISVRLCDCFTNCEINQHIIGYIAYGQWIIYHTLVASKVYNAFTFIPVTLYIPPSYHSQNCFCFFFFFALVISILLALQLSIRHAHLVFITTFYLLQSVAVSFPKGCKKVFLIEDIRTQSI